MQTLTFTQLIRGNRNFRNLLAGQFISELGNWFNFIAGFAYVAAGVGLFLWRRWAANLSAAIAITTVTVFAALAAHILLGGLFELRTIGAMTVRSLIWVVIAVLACRAMRCFEGMSRGSAA